MSSTITVVTDRIGDTLARHVSRAKNQLTLVAPFIKTNALERLLGGLSASVELTVITRWKADEIVAGVSDLSVLDFVRNRGNARLLLHTSVHAKVFLIEDAACIGSANVTDAALGFSTRPNAEAVTMIYPAPNSVFLFLARLERESIVATEELRRRFEEATKVVPPPWETPTVEMHGAPPRASNGPFPRFRNPERLYSAYLSVTGFSDSDIRASIFDDLVELNLTEGLDEPSFCRQVGAFLLATPLITDFDQFVLTPRYFGAMADWLKGQGVLTNRGQEERKRYLQTLVRWLRYFLPGRYRLEEPNYSELFGRAAGWAGGPNS